MPSAWDGLPASRSLPLLGSSGHGRLVRASGCQAVSQPLMPDQPQPGEVTVRGPRQHSGLLGQRPIFSHLPRNGLRAGRCRGPVVWHFSSLALTFCMGKNCHTCEKNILPPRKFAEVPLSASMDPTTLGFLITSFHLEGEGRGLLLWAGSNRTT